MVSTIITLATDGTEGYPYHNLVWFLGPHRKFLNLQFSPAARIINGRTACIGNVDHSRLKFFLTSNMLSSINSRQWLPEQPCILLLL